MEIAGYHLLEPLADKGPTTVYLAGHDQFAGRKFVIKLLKQEFAAEAEIAAAFLEQAKLAEQIRHHGFVRIYEYGEHEGAPYYVMDYIPGDSLESKHGSMCLLDKIYVIKRVARSLEYIAMFDRAHGNINPANIFIHEADSRVVLTDCGFTQDTAYRITYPESDHARLTRSYISPEQANFSGSDPRSDIYSLGAVFYALLVGTPPCDGTISVGLVAQVPELPRAKQIFQPLIDKALSKYPEDRFQSLRELVNALECFSDEDILRADGIELERDPEAVPEPAPEQQAVDVGDVGTEANESTVATIFPFAAIQQTAETEADTKTGAGTALAQDLKQSMADARSVPAQPAPRPIVRPASKPAAIKAAQRSIPKKATSKHSSSKQGSAKQSSAKQRSAKQRSAKQSLSKKATPKQSARSGGSGPLRTDADLQCITRRRTKNTKYHRGVAAGITLALLAGGGFYGVQNRAQVAGAYHDYLAPVLPREVVAWLDDTTGVAADLGSQLSRDIVSLIRTGKLARSNVAPQDQQIQGAPATGTDVGVGSGVTRDSPLRAVPEPSGHAELPGATLVPDAHQRKISELLALASAQVDSNHLLTPVEQSAYVYYQQVLALDEANEAALRGVADIAAHQYSLALEQQQQGNFEDAIELANSSAQLVPDGAKNTLINELEQQELERQQQLERTIARLLGDADRKVADGQLLRPARDNAVVAYRRILDLDPGNGIALVALERIKTEALLEVEEKLDNGKLKSADALITRIGIFFRTAGPELEALSTRLMQLRNAPARQADGVLTQAFLEQVPTGRAQEQH